jgi:hypothetical protein
MQSIHRSDEDSLRTVPQGTRYLPGTAERLRHGTTAESLELAYCDYASGGGDGGTTRQFEHLDPE